MLMHNLIRELREENTTKIVLMVADGLGGLPMEAGGKTELESARTPNLDACVREGVCGLSTPVLPGITPGSGPGHLGLFGYDPLQHRIGRGILEALGINFPVGQRDVAVRGNFCTVDSHGFITDRRAGRPATERCVAMCKRLARLVGMEIADAGATLADQMETLRTLWRDFDFFFLHYKYTDSTGEDGNFTAKVEMIEKLDAELPKVRALEPDVLMVTGDHSTPGKLRSHSWHPVPVVVWAKTFRPDPATEVCER